MAEEVAPRLADVRRSGEPFTDKDFPPTGTRLLPPSARSRWGVGWTRAQRIYGRGTTLSLFGDDGEPDPDEICQGGAGDCWFLSAMAIMAATKREALKRLVVSTKYSEWGLYVFRFYKEGQWVTVVIDDYIPCHFTAKTMIDPEDPLGEPTLTSTLTQYPIL